MTITYDSAFPHRSDVYLNAEKNGEVLILYVIFGAFGVVLNIISSVIFAVISTPQKPRCNPLILVTLSVNTVFSFVVFIFDLMYVVHGRISSDTECAAHAILLLILFMLSGYMHAIIAHLQCLDVCFGFKWERKPIIVHVIGGVLFSVTLSVLSIFLPSTGFSPMPSGTYCLASFWNPVSTATTFCGCLIPPAWMAVSYWRIYQNVLAGRAVLAKRGLAASQVKAGIIAEVKNMSVLVVLFFISACPFLCTIAMYVWITGRSPPAIYDKILSPPAKAFLTCLDPILLIALYPAARERAWRLMFGEAVSRMSEISSRKVNKVYVVSTKLELCEEFNNWSYWMKDEDLRKELLKWSEDNYVAENILFCAQEVSVLKNLSKLLMSTLEDAQNDSKKLKDLATPHSVEQEAFLGQWHQTQELITHIFEVYIQVPTAPLEVNIPHSCRAKIYSTLQVPVGVSGKFAPSFDVTAVLQKCKEDNPSYHFEDVTSYLGVFDEAKGIVDKIIETDIFPRFKRSTTFAAVVAKRGYSSNA